MNKWKPADERAFLRSFFEEVMDDFLQNLHSPSWWLSVVTVGILLSVVAAYATRGLDRLFRYFGKKWADRSEKSKDKFARKVAVLQQSPEARAAYFREEVRYRHTAIFGAVVATFLLGLLAAVSIIDSHGLTPGGSVAIGASKVSFIPAFVFGFYAISSCIVAFMSTAAYSAAQSMARHLKAAEGHLLP
ncbi:hypothetical protein [Burkholderia catarinensis]|uniref:hypothetical protein n=1 Tax=Burkholderia catarinensis TaxID=1108140 RepID=UPI00091235B6|nr:hypothetical protein [Burkholderia catarinensis]KAG8153076.1 hypothetical protein BFF94_014480 [Burkholderia catarinensis]